MDKFILVDSADNLYGLMQGSGAPASEWGKTLYAAYAFPAAAGKYSKNIIKKFNSLEITPSTNYIVSIWKVQHYFIVPN